MGTAPFVIESKSFRPDTLTEMSAAFDAVCAYLNASEKQICERIAELIVDFARSGVTDAATLCDLVVSEASDNA